MSSRNSQRSREEQRGGIFSNDREDEDDYPQDEQQTASSASTIAEEEGIVPETRENFLQRLEHFTWAWYTFPMSTGGIALLLSPRNQPNTFKALNTIGSIVYIFDLIVFVLITTAMTIRFSRHPSLLKRSLTHPSESLSFATCFLAMASIIGGMDLYGIPAVGSWLPVVYRVLFWVYFVVTFIVACGHYYLLFSHPKLKLQNMTPAWDLPIFPFMLCGTLAAIGASDQPPEHAIVMIVAGLTAQGLGMLVSLIMYVLYVHRMIEWGFPSPETRPAMFIAVGPPAFTSLALIGMANSFPKSIGYFGLEAHQTISVLKLLATVTALFIWCLAFWFFCLALVAVLAVSKTAQFRLSWWAFVFPNVGFTLATIKIGDMLESPGVHWVGSVMTIGLVAMYLFVLTMTIKAVFTRQIMSAGKDEDTYATEEKPKQRLRLQEEKPNKEA